MFNTTALPLCVNNSKYQKSSVPHLKHSILEILDYCDRVKKNVDLILHYQKLHYDYSEVGVILATNSPAMLTVCFKTLPYSFYWFKSIVFENIYIPVTYKWLSSKDSHHQRKRLIYSHLPLEQSCSIRIKIRKKRGWNKTLLEENTFTNKKNSLLS